MVKRTVVVLGIFSLILLMTAASSMAFNRPCFGKEFMSPVRPLYLPADCPDPIQRTIVSTWECNIEGPCPPVMPACCGGGGGRGDRQGLLTSLANVFGAPFDLLFAGRGGVYGCRDRGYGAGPCGSPFGGLLPRGMMSLTTLVRPGGGFFGGLW
jgi:hypothetical protein